MRRSSDVATMMFIDIVGGAGDGGHRLPLTTTVDSLPTRRLDSRYRRVIGQAHARAQSDLKHLRAAIQDSCWREPREQVERAGCCDTDYPVGRRACET